MDIRFYEVQYIPEIIFGVVIGLLFESLFLCRRVPLSLNITVCVLSFPLLLLAFELRTVVDHEVISIRFGRIPLLQHTIPLGDITGFKTVRYVPMGENFGVWQEATAIPPFLPWSSQALLLEFQDQTPYLIISRKINELKQAIETARKRIEAEPKTCPSPDYSCQPKRK